MVLKLNAHNYLLEHTETEDLIFRVSKDGVRPLSPEAYTIKAIDTPNKLCVVHILMGILNYFQDIWL